MKETRIELRIAEQTRDGIRQQLEEQTQRAPAAPGKRTVTITVPEIDARINEQRRQLDELLRKYTDQHPDVVGTRRLIAQLEEDRQREIEIRTKALDREPAGNPMSGDPVAQQLKVALNEAESNITTVRARLGEYEARYNQLKASAESLPKIDMELTQLNRDYDMQKRQYESLVARRETASLSGKLEDAGIAEFRIVDPPRVTPNPVAPNRPLLLGTVVAISLLAGLAMSWLVSQTRPTFHDGRSLREIAERPLLGMISMLPTKSLRGDAASRRTALRRRRHGIVRFVRGCFRVPFPGCHSCLLRIDQWILWRKRPNGSPNCKRLASRRPFRRRALSRLGQSRLRRPSRRPNDSRGRWSERNRSHLSPVSRSPRRRRPWRRRYMAAAMPQPLNPAIAVSTCISISTRLRHPAS